MKQLHVNALNLLKEIDRLCLNNGIRYYLGINSVLHLERFGGTNGNYKLDVFMPAEDIEAFVNVVEAEGKDGYELESMLTNENYLGFTLRYTDSSTTILSFKNGTNISCLGVAVEIYPIRKKRTGTKIRTINFLERGWESNGFNMTKNTGKKHQMGAQLVRVFSNIKGKASLAKKLFHILVKENSGAIGSKQVSIRRPKAHERVISGKYFGKGERVEFEGITLNAPTSRKELLETWFGMLWEEIDIKPPGDSIALDNVPYRAFMDECRRMNLDLDRLFSVKKENKAESIKSQKLISKKTEAVNIAKRSGWRLNLYEALKPVMNDIQKAYDEKDIEKLKWLLAENELVTIKYLRKNLGFAVNELCMNAQAEIFRQTGREELADKLIELVPVEHYKSIIE